MSEPTLIRVTVEAGVALLTLDNPPLNLVTLELTRRLRTALDRLAADGGDAEQFAVRFREQIGQANRVVDVRADVRVENNLHSSHLLSARSHRSYGFFFLPSPRLRGRGVGGKGVSARIMR